MQNFDHILAFILILIYLFFQSCEFAQTDIDAAKALLFYRYGPFYQDLITPSDVHCNRCYKTPKEINDDLKSQKYFFKTMENSSYIQKRNLSPGQEFSKAVKLVPLKILEPIQNKEKLHEVMQTKDQDQNIELSSDCPQKFINGIETDEDGGTSSDRKPMSSEDELKENLLDLNRNDVNKSIKIQYRRTYTRKQKIPISPLQMGSTRRKTKQTMKSAKIVHVSADFEELITLGPNGTKICKNLFDSLNWVEVSKTTRGLLRGLFSREILATHTLSGQPSPAFRGENKPVKGQLNPTIVDDIVYIVAKRLGVPPGDVRGSITNACADEGKLYKMAKKRMEMMKNQRSQEGKHHEEE